MTRPASAPGADEPPGDDTPALGVDTVGGSSDDRAQEVPAALGPTGSGPVEPEALEALDRLDDSAADRGRLDIHHSVVRKIAERAADLTEGTTTVARSVAGLGLGASGTSARVAGYGEQVDLRLEVPLAYPAPITVTVEAVRGNVRDRVETLTGYRVRGLDVIVSALTDPSAGPVRTSRTE